MPAPGVLRVWGSGDSVSGALMRYICEPGTRLENGRLEAKTVCVRRGSYGMWTYNPGGCTGEADTA